MSRTSDLADRARSKRDLAQRVRRLASSTDLHNDRIRLERHADDLEADAADLERRLAQGLGLDHAPSPSRG